MKYKCNGKVISETEAKLVEEKNRKIWDGFWSIPRDKRTDSDWMTLMGIQFCFSENLFAKEA